VVSFLFYLIYLFNFTLSASVKLPPILTPPAHPQQFKLYLVIPMLNEEHVIVPTIEALLAQIQRLPSRIDATVVVVNDDSSDNSLILVSELMAHLSFNQLIVLDRPSEQAHQGKGAVLNFATQKISEFKQTTSPRHTIIGVIDADSRIDAANLTKAVDFFADHPQIDMFQSGVAIYNTDNWLTRMQDFEFLGMNSAQQQVRERYSQGIASGNGQFVTLTLALANPWGHSLLEDLEFTLRAWLKGYHTAFNNDVVIHQSGIEHLAPLIKQRTRWCQGSLQCWRYLPRLWRDPQIQLFQKLDTTTWLFLPVAAVFLPLTNLIALLIQLVSALTAPANWISPALFTIVVLNLIICLFMALQFNRNAAASNPRKFIHAFWLSILFQFYLIPLVVVPYKATLRQILRLTNWEKTAHAAHPDS
jgi:cellulose synthase/poly-beta-1,6-N-acetylglucosamine synthase-like glycosyltransferase